MLVDDFPYMICVHFFKVKNDAVHVMAKYTADMAHYGAIKM